MHSRFPSLVILEAEDGEEALRTIPASLPDLIFMDVRLPDANGLELTRLIKDLFPAIKVVIVTNYDQSEYREEAYRCKADHYISKDRFMSVLGIIFSERPVS